MMRAQLKSRLALALSMCTFALYIVSAWHAHHWEGGDQVSFDCAEQQHCMLCHVQLTTPEPSPASTGIVLVQPVEPTPSIPAGKASVILPHQHSPRSPPAVQYRSLL
jgi:hypothetical protein